MESPAFLKYMVTARPISSILPIVEKSTVGGIEILRPPRTESFFMLSLPEIAGTLKAGGDIVQRFVGAHQLRHFVGSVRSFFRQHRIGPAEVIQPGDPVQLPAHADDAPHGFVDDARHHVVGIQVGIERD